MTPSPKMVEQIMGTFGEGETIGRHPELVDAMVAAGHDPVASAANLAEARAILTAIRGFRPQLRISGDDLAEISAPTLVVWGSHDPVGAPEIATQTANSIPDARLEMLDAGHLPWLGRPHQVGELTDPFWRRTADVFRVRNPFRTPFRLLLAARKLWIQRPRRAVQPSHIHPTGQPEMTGINRKGSEVNSPATVGLRPVFPGRRSARNRVVTDS